MKKETSKKQVKSKKINLELDIVELEAKLAPTGNNDGEGTSYTAWGTEEGAEC